MEFAYNSSRHSTTGLAPFQSLYGEVAHAPASWIHGPQPRCHSATVFAEGLMSSQLAARDAIQQANCLFRERHAQFRRGHTCRQGEEVLLSTDHLSLHSTTGLAPFQSLYGEGRHPARIVYSGNVKPKPGGGTPAVRAGRCCCHQNICRYVITRRAS